MNKMDCIKHCEREITNMWEKYNKPADFGQRREIYARCKEFCRKNGYTSRCFSEIWKKASINVHTRV